MRRNTNFFMVPLMWRSSPGIAGLSATAQLVFLHLVELCQTSGNGGVMTAGQVYAMARLVPRGRASVQQLIDSGVLVIGSGSTSDGQFHAADVQRIDTEQTPVMLSNSTRWTFDSNPQGSIPAGQKRSSRAISEKESPRAPARKEKEREIEREDERTPSGSVRSSSARAVPRSAGGAARPAPIADPPAAGTVVGDDDDDLTPLNRADAIAAAKSAIRNGQRKSPYSTGRDVTFSRYDPERKIVPLTSGFKIDGGAE